jgi:hypothetical protein
MVGPILGYSATYDNKPLKLPDSWSYSRLADYETCPARFAYKYIIKIPEGENEAFVRGNKVHKIAEKFVNGELGDVVPAEIASFGHLFQMLRQNPDGVFTEQQWAFTQDWQVTGWFGKPPKAAWVRNIVDLGINHGDGHMTLIDHKTGKKYDTNEEQVEQFGMSAFLRFPDVQTVETRLWYLDTGDEVVRHMARKSLPVLKAKWKLRTEPMFFDKYFAPRKNSKCKWCPFSGNSGGPCLVG